MEFYNVLCLPLATNFASPPKLNHPRHPLAGEIGEIFQKCCHRRRIFHPFNRGFFLKRRRVEGEIAKIVDLTRLHGERRIGPVGFGVGNSEAGHLPIRDGRKAAQGVSTGLGTVGVIEERASAVGVLETVDIRLAGCAPQPVFRAGGKDVAVQPGELDRTAGIKKRAAGKTVNDNRLSRRKARLERQGIRKVRRTAYQEEGCRD